MVQTCWSFVREVDPVLFFYLTVLIEGFIGTEVKRALTSYDVITSPGSSITSIMCCMKW